MSLRSDVPSERRDALRKVAELRDPAFIGELIAEMDSEDGHLRDIATGAVTDALPLVSERPLKFTASRDYEQLRNHLGDADPTLVSAIIRVLARIHDCDALPLLEDLSAQESAVTADPRVRAALDEAIPELTRQSRWRARYMRRWINADNDVNQ